MRQNGRKSLFSARYMLKAMLADVRAHVSTMLVDLAELMMFVAQQK